VWPPAGRDVLDLAHEEALQILHNHQPPPLPPGAAGQIESVVAEADRALGRHEHVQ
jgi:hypothetical protein